MSKRKKILSILMSVFISISLVACSNNNKKIDKTKDEIRSDLNGFSIGSHKIEKSEIKNIEILDQKVNDDKASISINLDLEYTSKGAGNSNEYLIRNDILNKLTVDIVLNYGIEDEKWKLENLDNIENIKTTTSEVKTSIEETKFKNDQEVLNDLKENNISVQTKDNPSISVRFSDSTINLKDFKITNIEEKKGNKALLDVTISINADFELTGMDELDGHYNGTGEFKALYRLEDNNNQPYWRFSSIYSNSSQIKLTSLN